MDEICRKFEEKDISVLVELIAQLGYEHSEASLISNVESVRDSGGEVFVSECAGSVSGCISVIISARLAEGVNGEIVSLVVGEGYRGRGLGKALVETAEKWLKKCTGTIYIRANTMREDAHQFYNALGYTFSKTQAVFKKNL